MDTCWTNIENDAIWRLRIDGPCLNTSRVERLRQEIRRANSVGAKGIVIDLQCIERVNAFGIAGIASLSKDVGPSFRIALAALQPEVQQAVLRVHLHELVDIYEDARAAVLDLSTPISNP